MGVQEEYGFGIGSVVGGGRFVNVGAVVDPEGNDWVNVVGLLGAKTCDTVGTLISAVAL